MNQDSALPVLDQMGVKNYQVIDHRQIHIYEHLEESGVNQYGTGKTGNCCQKYQHSKRGTGELFSESDRR